MAGGHAGAKAGALLVAVLSVTAARADVEAPPPADIHPSVSAPWLAAQLVPSPEWLVSSRGVDFGLRWQLTPFLYSFGVHHKLSPARLFVVEPLVRHAGSIELFVSPEHLSIGPRAASRFGARLGVRAYYPLDQGGEYLSCSLGTSYLHLAGEGSAALEAGLYVLYGTLGLQVAYSPRLAGGSALSTLSFRYF